MGEPLKRRCARYIHGILKDFAEPLVLCWGLVRATQPTIHAPALRTTNAMTSSSSISSGDCCNRITASHGGRGPSPSTILASSPASGGMLSRLRAAGDGDKKALGVAIVLGVSLAGALAFAYSRPADNKW